MTEIILFFVLLISLEYLHIRNIKEREINQPHHTAGEIKKSLIYIGNLSITKYYTKS